MDKLKFSGIGRKGIIEERDCLFNQYKVKSSFLRREDVMQPYFEFDKPIYLQEYSDEELERERENLTI